MIITRQKFSFILSFIVYSLLMSCNQNSDNPETVLEQKKPNFLFIITDDQTFESINAVNNKEIITPTLDKLSNDGFTFTHAFNEGAWGGAVCVASRAMINSGQRVWHARSGVQQDTLWGELFQQNGYYTFLTGKWHNGGKTALKSFTEIQGLGRGMYETKQGMKGPRYKRTDWSEWHPTDTSWNGQWRPLVRHGIRTDTSYTLTKEIPVSQHSSEYFSDQAIDFLNSYNKDQPFLMYVSYTMPHDPKQVPQKYLDMYPEEDIKIPVNYIDEHPFDQGHHAIRDEILAPIPRTEKAIKTHRREYYASITHTDEQIGRILKALDEKGISDNTYVIMTADHGLAVGMHGLMGKQNMYDHSVRMPLIIRGPGIKAGTRSDELVYMQSMFATTAELASIKTPTTVEYPSLKSLIEGSGNGEEYIYGGYINFQRMIRNKKFKMILYPHNQKFQLFNIEKDPYEMNDISGDNVEVMEQMYAELLKIQKINGDTLKLEKYWEQ